MRVGHVARGFAVVGLVGVASVAWQLVAAHDGERGARARALVARAGGAGEGQAPAAATLQAPAATRALDGAPQAANVTAGRKDATVAEAAPPPKPTPTLRSWQLSDDPAPATPGTEHGHVGLRRAVRVAEDSLGALRVGDRVTLDLPTGSSFVAEVGRVDVSAEGDRTWSGHLEGHGRRFPVTFTQGDVAAFATIASPEGLFSLEAFEGEGAIYYDDRERLQDPRLSCAVLPD